MYQNNTLLKITIWEKQKKYALRCLFPFQETFRMTRALIWETFRLNYSNFYSRYVIQELEKTFWYNFELVFYKLDILHRILVLMWDCMSKAHKVKHDHMDWGHKNHSVVPNKLYKELCCWYFLVVFYCHILSSFPKDTWQFLCDYLNGVIKWCFIICV